MLQYVVTCKRTLTNEKYTQLFAIIHFTLNVILSNQFQEISGSYCSMEELILIHTHQYWLSIKSATPLHQKYKICMKNNYKTYSLGACLRNVLTVLRYIAVLIIKSIQILLAIISQINIIMIFTNSSVWQRYHGRWVMYNEDMSNNNFTNRQHHIFIWSTTMLGLLLYYLKRSHYIQQYIKLDRYSWSFAPYLIIMPPFWINDFQLFF